MVTRLLQAQFMPVNSDAGLLSTPSLDSSSQEQVLPELFMTSPESNASQCLLGSKILANSLSDAFSFLRQDCPSTLSLNDIAPS
jgi:hypothetical protein